MKQFIEKNKKALIGSFAILLVAGITMSFLDAQFAYTQFHAEDEYLCTPTCKDTVPNQPGMSMKEFEKLQSTIDQSLEKVNIDLQKLDLSKMQKEIEQSLRNIDMDKIRADVDQALKNINMDKMLTDATASLNNINPDYKREEIEKALAEARKEIEKAKLDIKEIDRTAIDKEIKEAKKELEKSKKELAKIDVSEIMQEAKAGINKAKAELKLTGELFHELEKDGLIDRKKGFTIEYTNKDLMIDGKKQPASTTDKYRKYFKEDNFKIKIDKD